MAKRPLRRSIAVLALAATVLALAGCDMVKAGAKCRAGSPAGRDKTHVLFCQKGRWTRVMTIGQAADFIVSSWPSTVTLIEGGGQTTGVGESFAPVVVRVTRRDGQPVKGADVTFSNADPRSGAGMAAPSGLVATDANGIARFTPVANGTIGGYGVDAKVNGGLAPYVTFGLNNSAGPAANLSVVSGGGQSAAAGTQFAPVGVRATDKFGNVVTYKNIEFSSTAPGVWFGPAEAFAGEDGIASTTIGTGNKSGPIPITAKVVGADATTTFNLTVVAGAIHPANDFFANDGLSTNPPSDPTYPNRLNNPLNVFLSDIFGNGVPGVPVQFTIVPVDSGSGGTFDANNSTTVTILTDADGIAGARLHDNGTGGTFQVRADYEGRSHDFTVNP